MVSSCSVHGCKKRFRKNGPISFYRFPPVSNPDRRRAWIEVLNQSTSGKRKSIKGGEEWQPSIHDRICSSHFQTGHPSQVISHPDYIPNKNLHIVKCSVKKLQTSTPRGQRKQSLKGEESQQSQEEIADTTSDMTSVSALLEFMGVKDKDTQHEDIQQVPHTLHKHKGRPRTSTQRFIKLKGKRTRPSQYDNKRLESESQSQENECQNIKNIDIQANGTTSTGSQRKSARMILKSKRKRNQASRFANKRLESECTSQETECQDQDNECQDQDSECQDQDSECQNRRNVEIQANPTMTSTGTQTFQEQDLLNATLKAKIKHLESEIELVIKDRQQLRIKLKKAEDLILNRAGAGNLHLTKSLRLIY